MGSVSPSSDWLLAFPIQPATEAVEALHEAWSELSTRYLPTFNHKTKEPIITKKLKIYVDDVISKKRGLLGMWSAEDIIGVLDPTSGNLLEERRTDIVYSWNSTSSAYRIVFEFKRLGRAKSYRNSYLGEHGLSRFVTGIYARHQAVAAMVGILLVEESEVLQKLLEDLELPQYASSLRLKVGSTGRHVVKPSRVFRRAAFDTEHDRDPALAPAHGSICVTHLFFNFGYAPS